MRMNRRSFSVSPVKVDIPPEGNTYKVWLYSLTSGQVYDYGVFPDGVYGEFAAGEEIEIDLTVDSGIDGVSGVFPNDPENMDNIDWWETEYNVVNLVMPAYDVLVEVFTRY